ncbi:DNA adenine methyltransferase YhdJ [Anaerohalosphaera lusitana]|uniref:Methyltransferase n=1 Tax=Anaerohalosphaera lusitana TaxID=1936003 RepID=A0A1U9NQC3_9BACT|nr:site-specific DNA-methyltransferase [Anaerohalosphaera lusitana]AQT70109.1 DNA adenine methyltransferase YhdJ [Anaerohalosphaera lusitana]
MQNFKNKILCGDCIEMLNGVDEPVADLIFADPPFNIGYEYDKYKDTLKSEKYITWTRDWMGACVNALKPHGSFYIAIGDDYAHHIRLIGEQLGLTLRNWIIWHYTFGQQTKTMFARSHTHIFYFVKDKADHVFNDHAVRVPSDRQLVYADKRANPRGKMPDDVWNTFSRVCGTFKEREGWHPCQMPELLLGRIVSVSSNRGDLVLDPFNGSGTTVAAAYQLERDYCGIDISSNYVENSRKRLEKLAQERQNLQKDGEILDMRQRIELKRFYFEVRKDVSEILRRKSLLEIFTKLYNIRLNEERKFDPQEVATALQGILD